MLEDILINPIDLAAYTRPQGSQLTVADILRDAGMKPPHFLTPNTINRFQDKDDKAGKKSGWSWHTVFQGDYGAITVMKYGSWRMGDVVTWCSHDTSTLSRDEIRQLNDQMERAAKAADEAREESQREAKIEVESFLRDCKQSDGDHPYLAKKKVKAYKGVMVFGADLIIPITIDGDVWSFQRIDKNGDKRFKAGGRIKGGYFVIEGDDTVVICEGYATGATIHEQTGFTVVVAFNAGNLMDVAYTWKEKAAGRIIIAADDDRFGDKNVGVEKATAAAKAISADMVMPVFGQNDMGTDFNDMDHSKVKDCFNVKIIPNDIVKSEMLTAEIHQIISDIPHGVISKIVDYYNATSKFDQPGFALNTALAITSVLCARNFQTDEENFTSLFFMNIGNTSTGKEHCKTVSERILKACKMNLMTGDGFTSAGAVVSALLMKPRFISVIDELGMYLKAGAQNNSNQVEANSAIMQVFGRCHSTYRPKNYSTMTLGKKQREDVENREVENPAVTLIGMTTPSTLFESLSHKDILSGFINRFIIHVSDMPISVGRRRIMVDVPQSIVDWAKKINERVKAKGTTIELASTAPTVEVIPFSDVARDIQEAFNHEVVEKQNELLPQNLEGLGGRINEIAMRLALICALSRDPNTKIIADIDMIWATNFMRKQFSEMIAMVQKYMRSSNTDADTMEMVDAIKRHGLSGVKRSQLIRDCPIFRKYTKDQTERLLANAIEAGMITTQTVSTGGRPTVIYYA